MRRIILAISAILGLLFTIGSCVTQGQSTGQPLTQRGNATQEITVNNTDEGLTARHPSLPIGSKSRVTNPVNGKTIEVTIIGRIPPSPTRLIDLSPAPVALDVGESGTVIINQILPSRARPEPSPPPEP